jgi:hypothetical protein
MMHILLVLLSYMLRLICSQPGDPDNKDLEEQENPEKVLGTPLRGSPLRDPVPVNVF